jgi:hypothetical protein
MCFSKLAEKRPDAGRIHAQCSGGLAFTPRLLQQIFDLPESAVLPGQRAEDAQRRFPSFEIAG